MFPFRICVFLAFCDCLDLGTFGMLTFGGISAFCFFCILERFAFLEFGHFQHLGIFHFWHFGHSSTFLISFFGHVGILNFVKV